MMRSSRRRDWLRRPTPTRGFTLFELLIVLVLIGLVTSMAVLGIRTESPGDRQQREAQRLIARMDLAREEAVMRAQSLGLQVEDGGYRFVQMVDGQWQPLQGHALPPHELPEGQRLEVDVEGQDIVLGGAGGEEADDAEHRPQIFFLAGGEVIPTFQLRLISADTMTEYRVHPGERRWLALSREDL
ncbi:MAG: type II secretion system minor pseudopilin GspH [Halofilum sp. (in: g-proteobacteria)]